MNNEGEDEVCAGVGTSMLYPYSGDDTILETPEQRLNNAILETPEQAPKV